MIKRELKCTAWQECPEKYTLCCKSCPDKNECIGPCAQDSNKCGRSVWEDVDEVN